MAIACARVAIAEGGIWVVHHGGKWHRVTALPPDASTGDLIRFSDAHDILATPLERVAPDITRAALSPVTARQQLIFQLGNFHTHLREIGVRDTASVRNVFFAKAPSSLAPASGTLKCPPEVRLLDYEIELGLVLRRDARGPIDVDAAQIGDWVAGLTIVNDVSARDVQLRDGQYFRGKSFRGFCRVGPLLLLLEHRDWQRLDELRLTLAVNGQTRQDCLFSDRVHPPHRALSDLSRFMDFETGDLLATGTPGGCAIRAPALWVQRLFGLLPEDVRWRMFLGRQATSRRYLKAGDRIEASIFTADGALELGRQILEVT